MICIGKNSLPVLGCSIGVGGLLNAETLEETIIVLAAADVFTTKGASVKQIQVVRGGLEDLQIARPAP